MDEIKKSNPNTTFFVNSKETVGGKQLFTGFYVCFKALKDGFLEGCKRVIGLDGVFLKGVYKGQLLVVVSKDGNNQMFPLASVAIKIKYPELNLYPLKLYITY